MTNLGAYINAGSSSFSNLLFTNFKGTDLTSTELMVYLFLSQYVQNHSDAPDLQRLAADAKMQSTTFMNALNSLCAKKAVELVTTTDAAGKLVDHYDVTPLLEELSGKPVTPETDVKTASESPIRKVTSQVETEFGRLLTPIEQQMIRDWLNIDHYNPDLISLALREAVLNQAYSLKYMDRVLLRWEKQHLTTPEAVRRQQQKFDSL
ncbi:DnaD domain-containing protein [Lacticaseibacillus hulanensis]|uniref:DnaD domain-containing protein n=1 Tax=Lacticaseibacillus hulanensis TaxID=2493111 RepID=UPI000FD8A06A|nr:DnaD domain protein [Lacticaseibacillus hulanensis]